MQAKCLPLSRIDFKDDTFSLNPAPDKEMRADLSDSIERAGLLHPPIVKEKAVHCFQIVAGRRRLLAVGGNTPAHSCLCLVLPQDLPEAKTLAIALEDALLADSLTPISKAIFFRKILRLLPEDQACAFLPALGLGPHPYHIRELLALLELEEPLIHAIHERQLDETVARQLSNLPFSDRIAVFEMIKVLHLSVSNQKKLTTICCELAARDNVSVISILGAPEINDILCHPQANTPQKTSMFMTWLQTQRFPRLSAAEKEFRSLTGQLQLPKEASLSHSPSFEQDTLTLSITFKNRTELLKKWPDLKQALHF